MIATTAYKARPYRGEEDLQPLVDLFNAADEVDKLQENTDVDDLRNQVTQPDMDAARDIRIWEDAEGRPVASVLVQIRPDETTAGGYMFAVVHPDIRNSGIEDDLFAWATERTREAADELGKKAELRAFSSKEGTYYISHLERLGFEPVRYFFKMRRPLDQPIAEPQFPERYTFRNISSDDDVVRWVECFNQSFIDHYDFHAATVERRKHRMKDVNYNADLDLIAIAPDGTFAGFCRCTIYAEHNKRNNINEGWIDVLGTRRGHRKIGLGKAMLLLGLRKLKEAGADVGVLGVDAENPTGALGLYESVGFEVEKTEVAFRYSHPPGPPQAGPRESHPPGGYAQT